MLHHRHVNLPDNLLSHSASFGACGKRQSPHVETRAREAGLDERTIDLAEQGNADAQYSLGERYTTGEGVERDPVAKARLIATDELSESVRQMGGNAVVGIDIDYEVIGKGGSMLMVSISGTAVTIA